MNDEEKMNDEKTKNEERIQVGMGLDPIQVKRTKKEELLQNIPMKILLRKDIKQ